MDSERGVVFYIQIILHIFAREKLSMCDVRENNDSQFAFLVNEYRFFAFLLLEIRKEE